MVRISAVTVGVGIAVMVIALAVIGGFRREITDKLTGFGGHVRLTSNSMDQSLLTPPLRLDTVLESAVRRVPGFGSVSPYAVVNGVIKTPDALHGIVLKGVAGDYDSTFFRRSLVRGRLPRVNGQARYKDLLVSRTVADMLRIDTADRIEMMFLGGDGMRRDAFKISGIYSTGMDELDRTVALTDLRNVQRLLGWGPQVGAGYEVNTDRFDRLDEFSEAVYEAVLDYTAPDGSTVRVDNVKDLNPGIFDWLRAHNVNAAVIIAIMLVVAFLNMASALLIILLERTSMIGVLRALGMRVRSVQKIFLLRSLNIVLTGMFWGNAAAVGLLLLQKHTGWVKLDQEGYMLSEVPVALEWSWWIPLNICLPIVMMLLLSIPVLTVSRIRPDITMRYQQ